MKGSRVALPAQARRWRLWRTCSKPWKLRGIPKEDVCSVWVGGLDIFKQRSLGPLQRQTKRRLFQQFGGLSHASVNRPTLKACEEHTLMTPPGTLPNTLTNTLGYGYEVRSLGSCILFMCSAHITVPNCWYRWFFP